MCLRSVFPSNYREGRGKKEQKRSCAASGRSGASGAAVAGGFFAERPGNGQDNRIDVLTVFRAVEDDEPPSFNCPNESGKLPGAAVEDEKIE